MIAALTCAMRNFLMATSSPCQRPWWTTASLPAASSPPICSSAGLIASGTVAWLPSAVACRMHKVMCERELSSQTMHWSHVGSSNTSTLQPGPGRLGSAQACCLRTSCPQAQQAACRSPLACGRCAQLAAWPRVLQAHPAHVCSCPWCVPELLRQGQSPAADQLSGPQHMLAAAAPVLNCRQRWWSWWHCISKHFCSAIASSLKGWLSLSTHVWRGARVRLRRVRCW